jgi:hypothetical protein
MQKLHPQQVDTPTYNFGVYTTIGVSYSIDIFRVNHNISNGAGPIYYYTCLKYLSNGLSSDRKGDHMKTLRPRKVDIPTYHFGFTKFLAFHLLGSCLGKTIDK